MHLPGSWKLKENIFDILRLLHLRVMRFTEKRQEVEYNLFFTKHINFFENLQRRMKYWTKIKSIFKSIYSILAKLVTVIYLVTILENEMRTVWIYFAGFKTAWDCQTCFWACKFAQNISPILFWANTGFSYGALTAHLKFETEWKKLILAEWLLLQKHLYQISCAPLRILFGTDSCIELLDRVICRTWLILICFRTAKKNRLQHRVLLPAISSPLRTKRPPVSQRSNHRDSDVCHLRNWEHSITNKAFKRRLIKMMYKNEA